MARPELVTMSMREQKRFKFVEAVVRGELKPWRAAEKLHLSTRQVERLANRWALVDPLRSIGKSESGRIRSLNMIHWRGIYR